MRAVLTRLRQAGHSVERSRAEDGQTVYRMRPGVSAKAGSGEVAAGKGGSPGAMEAAPVDDAAEAPDATVFTPTSAASGAEECPIPAASIEVTFANGRTAEAPQLAAQDGEVS